MILRAAGGSEGILKYVLDYVSDPEYETGYIDAWINNKELYKYIEEHFTDKKAVGVRPYNVMHLVANAVLDADEPGFLDNVQNYTLHQSIRFAVANSLPITYEKGNVNIVFGENARYISEDELKFGNIIDITAAKILIERGIDVGILSFEDNGGYNQEGFTDVPNEYFIDEDEYVRLSPLKTVDLKHKDGVKILSEYHTKSSKKMGAFEYENSDGIRFLVYPFDVLKAKENSAQGWFNSYSRRRQVVKSIEWLGKKRLPVYPEGNYPALYILAKENDDAVVYGLWNLFQDKIPQARICVDCEGEVEFVNCKGHREGNVVVIDTILYPYEFAGFEIKKYNNN